MTTEEDKEPSIIDNRDVKFIDEFRKYCDSTKELKVAVGYLYLSGFDLVKESLRDIENIRIVMGAETDIETAEAIELGYKSRISKVIQNDLSLITNPDQGTALAELHDLIKNGKVEVKVYVKGKFHAKVYIFEGATKRIGSVAILGSSNFSRAGLGADNAIVNTELNSIHKDSQDLNIIRPWFEKIWIEADSFQLELLHIIESSQPYIRLVKQDRSYVSPKELFKTLTYEFMNHDVAPLRDILAEFQKIGILNAKEKIRDLNGCIISDSVGLGKTLIGCGLIQDFQREGNNILLITPASIKDNWIREMNRRDQNGNRAFEIDLNDNRLKILTITEISRLDLANESDFQILQELKSKYSVIVIDEAHRFRNAGRFDLQTNSYSGNKNYANIQELRTTDKKYVMLTATPLNNSIQDLANILSLFTNPTLLKNKNHLLEFSHFEEYYKTLKRIQRRTDENASDSELTELKFRLNDHLQGIILILEEVMILRTRSDISQRYPNLIINGKKVTFDLAQIFPQEYEFPRTYLPIYDNISEFLLNLNVPHITLLNESSGQTLTGLYKILLFKRLESSIFSFVESLGKLRNKEVEFLEEIRLYGLKETKIRRRHASTKSILDLDGDSELTDWIDEQRNNAQDNDKQDVEQLILDDLKSIDNFLNKFIPSIKKKDPYEYDDPKLLKLIKILDSVNNQKAVIFTQYIDTVDYLYNNLQKYAISKKIEIDSVVGQELDDKNSIGTNRPKERKIKLFAPTANDYKLGDDEKEIDLLITTDALSEGVNLQDCSNIINYDLPWNPMRIVQRIGRVDRIGSSKRVTAYNIFPDKDLDTLLDLLGKLATKIKNIAAIIGKENYILSEEEQINPHTIGEKIKEISKIDNFAKYESVAQNSLLKGIHEKEEKSIKMLELKSKIASLNIEPEDFRDYELPVYSIIRDNSKKGLFAMFRIFDKTKEDELASKIEDFILYIDFKTKEIKNIGIDELDLDDSLEGITKNDISIKYNLKDFLSELENYFKKIVYDDWKSRFKKTKMRLNFRASRLQQYVVQRLTSITVNSKLTSEPLDKDVMETAKFLLREFKEKILDKNIVESMKSTYDTVGNVGDVNSIIQDIVKMSDDEFVKKTDHFYGNYIKNNPQFANMRNEEDIKYKMICWGAFV